MNDAAGLVPRLSARLAALAAEGHTSTYGALAADLAIPGPGSIAKLTAALETLMDIDAAANRPLRAALVTARGSSLPAPGFFQKAASLGFDASSPEALHTHHLARLFRPV